MRLCHLLLLHVGLFACQRYPTTKYTHHPVEYLTFMVEPTMIDEFIRLENEIWTDRLMKETGFVSKDIWVNNSNPGEVSVIIYWKSFDDWKSIPKQVTNRLTEQFDSRFGRKNYQLTREVHGYNRTIRVSTTD